MTRLREVACIRASPDGAVWSARWRPQGDVFATCGQDKHLRLFEATSNLCVQDENGDERVHTRSLRRVVWRGDGELLAVASFDAKVSLWRWFPEGQSGSSGSVALVTALVGHENEVKGVAFSPDGDLLASCSRDKAVFLYDLRSTCGVEYAGGEVECVGVLQGHSQDVKSVCFSRDGEYLVSTSYDDSVKIWTREVDEDDWHLHATLKGHASTVWAGDFDEAGRHFVSVSADTTLRVWRVRDSSASSDPRRSCAFPRWLVSPLFKTALAKVSGDSSPVWPLLTTVQGVHAGPILDVAWQGERVATVCGDNKLRVFDASNAASLVLQATLEFPCEPNSVQWRPLHGGELLVALDDGTVRRVLLAE